MVFDLVVNIIIGLLFVRIFFDYGIVFDIVGWGIVDVMSMKVVIKLGKELIL